MTRLAGKVAVVAETADGIGLAAADRFAREGASVVCLDRSRERAEAAAGRVGAALGLGCDVTVAADCAAVADRVASVLGRVDVLYNNASVLATGRLEELSEAEWDRVFAINVKAIYQLTRALLPLLRTSESASIVNLASSLALIGYPGLPAYVASKGAVRLLTKAMALDYAGEGIRVNCICHGGVDDPLFHSLFEATGRHDAAVAEFLELIPLGRLASVEDMASAAVFLASPESASTTGAELLVDGGQTAR